MHGAKGGPKTKAGLIKCTIMPFKHGCYSKEVLEEVRFMKKSLKQDNRFKD
jgi:hypothetical protein